MPTVTSLATPVVLSQAKYAKYKRAYPLVSGTAVPKEDVAQLRSVTLSITGTVHGGVTYVQTLPTGF